MAEMTLLHMYLFTNFVYNCFFRKDEKKPYKTSQFLKMKTPFKKEQHFENENTFQKRTTF